MLGIFTGVQVKTLVFFYKNKVNWSLVTLSKLAPIRVVCSGFSSTRDMRKGPQLVHLIV